MHRTDEYLAPEFRPDDIVELLPSNSNSQRGEPSKPESECDLFGRLDFGGMVVEGSGFAAGVQDGRSTYAAVGGGRWGLEGEGNVSECIPPFIHTGSGRLLTCGFPPSCNGDALPCFRHL